MKSKCIKPLLLFPIFFLTFWYAGSSVYAENESQSPIHELPKANQCDVIIINIRELSFARKEVLKEISSLENPAGSALENNEYSQQQINEYEQRMKLLQESIFASKANRLERTTVTSLFTTYWCFCKEKRLTNQTSEKVN